MHQFRRRGENEPAAYVRKKERIWVTFIGDFPQLRNALAEKSNFPWIFAKTLDALLRGFGQVAFANNPISGLLIAVAMAATVPGTFLFCTSTAVLGLLVSMLIREPQQNLANGLTVFNPLLVGALTYNFIPKYHDSFDGFLFFLIFITTIFSVYLTRSFGNKAYPVLTLPFNLTELLLLFTLVTTTPTTTSSNFVVVTGNTSSINSTGITRDNATPSDAEVDDARFIVGENTSAVVNLDWGMIFQGVVTSASQVYGVNDVIVGSVVYLGILIYSPIMAGFSFTGALIGCLTGLALGIPYESVYSGLWGFNSLLTGAALGGFYFVPTVQTAVATLVTIVFTTIVQHAMEPLLAKFGLPVLTVPFLVAIYLFLGLRDSPGNAFPRPQSMSFPEKHRYDFLAARRALRSSQLNESSDPEIAIDGEDKETLRDSHDSPI